MKERSEYTREIKDILTNLAEDSTAGIEFLGGGRNSKLIHIRSENDCVLKVHKTCEKFERERYDREKNFLIAASALGIECVPEIIDYNDDSGWILMSMIKGDRVSCLSAQCLRSAIDFQCLLVKNEKALRLYVGDASDAQFTIKNHVTAVRRKLEIIKATTSTVYEEMSKALIGAEQYANRYNCLDFDKEGDTWVSPSDVGIHNMIRTDEGFAFVDFEHSGIEEASKFVINWMIRPDTLMTCRDAELFMRECEERWGARVINRNRISALLLVYAISWQVIAFKHAGTSADSFLVTYRKYIDSVIAIRDFLS